MYIYIHTYLYKCMHLHTYLPACLPACLPTNQPTYLHTYMHTCIHAYVHAYIHTLHTCMHAYMHAYIHTYIHTCMHAYIHTYIHTVADTYTYPHTHGSDTIYPHLFHFFTIMQKKSRQSFNSATSHFAKFLPTRRAWHPWTLYLAVIEFHSGRAFTLPRADPFVLASTCLTEMSFFEHEVPAPIGDVKVGHFGWVFKHEVWDCH